MQNSFSLGVLHGVLYGITPLTPWFLALKRYVFEGPTKGLLTFVGLCLGQFGLVVLAFFGNREVLMLWYFVEPVLVMCGVCVLWLAFTNCWDPRERPTPIATRKEASKYVASGVLFAFCNPGGLMFGDLLLTALPENTWLYLFGFFLVYASLMAGVIYLAFFSPRAPFQEWFGPCVLPRNPSGYQLAFNYSYYSPRVRNLRVMAMATAAVLFWQVANYNDSGFWVAYTDMVYTPPFVQGKSDFALKTADDPKGARKRPNATLISRSKLATNVADTEADEDARAEAESASNEPLEAKALTVETAKNESRPHNKPSNAMNKDTLQSVLGSGRASGDVYGEEEEWDLDEAFTPWDTIIKYDTWNDKLDRETLPNDWKEVELKFFYDLGLNTVHKQQLVTSLHLRKAPLWETKESPTQRLTNMREEMDKVVRDSYTGIATDSKNRTFTPFSSKYEADYDFEPAANPDPDPDDDDDDDEEDEDEVDEQDEKDLKLLVSNPEVWATGFFDPTYEMFHRGGSFEDFSAVQMRSLPQEIHFPWDYPALESPNVPEVNNDSEDSDVARRSEMQNKNVWFLDPIALNTRFLANNPFVLKDDGRIRPHHDLVEIKASNTTRRWWLGKDNGTPADTVKPAVTNSRTKVVLK
jgi:threonine/homoserine/homoserine lactone efflux protein